MASLQVLPGSSASRPNTAHSPPFACSWTNRGSEAACLHLAGVLDFATVSQLARTLREFAWGERLIVLDLRELESIDYFGVHAIANASIRARKLGRRLVLLRGAADVDRMFTQAGRLDDVEIGDLQSGVPPVQVLLQLAERERSTRQSAPMSGQTSLHSSHHELL
jgi:anti-anti-sigma factor